ncbi:uncharacterized protein SPSK_03927 [Sporothrix schenckii 1099-18]|uniref:DUF6536 domain-containing protein n=1 Tax=Sporothrix schenckii 1099-18 TaxID=1397361 RepID=A0A0F2M422_SPOSC|nr:uncharacterized protein SPSK_03927 [Sporothrix schenckii 1099-18]KJR82926.1 hypothetical protein SPSK_03927 [Sporothrix schenckii 1099-18]
MEIVIPPRDHGTQADKYAWDDNGEVTQIRRIGSRPQPRKKPRLARQTVQWPFQSVSLEDNTYALPPVPQSPSSTIVSSPEEVHLPPNYRATWQPRRGAVRGYGAEYISRDDDDDDDDDDDNKSTLRRSLIPDYVINYLRGETPETVAQRKLERQRAEEALSQENLVNSSKDHDGRLGLRGGGDGQPLPSPDYRRSDEPIWRGTNSDYYDNSSNEKRRSSGPMGQRRWPTRRRRVVGHGWKAGVALHGTMIIIIFVVGLVGLVVARTVLHHGGKSDALATLYTSRAVPIMDTRGTSCAGAHPVAWLLRAVLALFSVALLAGAQYVFHILSSPTRAELDAAHATRRWLDIGVPSLRNIAFLLGLRKARAVLALVVVAVAMASTVLYGALVNVVLVAPLSSMAVPSYNVLLVAPSFLDGDPFSNASSNNAGGLDRVTILQLQQLASNTKQPTLTNLTAEECLESPSSASAMSMVQAGLSLFDINDVESDSAATSISTTNFSAVMIVLTDAAVDVIQATNSSVVETAPAGSVLLAADESLGSSSSSSSSVFQITTGDSESSDRSSFIINENTVAFCLVQEAVTTAAAAQSASNTDDAATTTCIVTLNTSLLSAVVGLNMVTALCFAYMLLPRKAHRHFRHAPLVTLGDAVASFLRDPDPTTRGACLLSKADVVQHGVWKSMVDMPRLPQFGPPQTRVSTESNGSGQSAQQPENIMQPMFLEVPASDGEGSSNKNNYFWFQSVSLVRWFVGAVVWWTLVGLALAALVAVVSRNNRLGAFGQISPLSSAVFGLLASSSSTSWMTSVALLGSLPYLGVAILYFVVDTHVSGYFLSHEFAQYIATHQHQRNDQLQQHGRHPLRVSYRPRGHQTASLYLTLPQPWHWTLLTLVAGIVFALGQSVVVTGVEAVEAVTSGNDNDSSSARLALLGFSGIGLVVVLVLLVGLALMVVVLGARRTPPPNVSLGGNPLTLPGGSCSAVISARCHPTPEEMPTEMTRQNGSKGGPLPLWLRPLAWGPVPAYHHPYQGYNRRRGLTREGLLSDGTLQSQVEDDNIDGIVGHCTFSSGPLMPLDAARSYA